MFVNWKSNLYLGLYVNKLLAELVSIYIASKIDEKFVIFFEDDFLIFYKKDARIDMKLKLRHIIKTLNKIRLDISFKKTKYWR